YLSDGRAVYALWRPGMEKRLPYLCQICVGLPALPALLQSYRVGRGEAPLAGGLMAPPPRHAQLNDRDKTMNRYFELGTVYTMIAGLLNVLAIYDALAGPAHFGEEEEKEKKDQPPINPLGA